MYRHSSLLLLLIAWPASFAVAQGTPQPLLAADEIQRVLAFGPWPPTITPDPSNRVSGKPRAIELGRRLFRDPRMSPVGYIACVTCHQPDRSFTDLKARAHGLADLPRNTPALANLRQQHWFGWGGSSDSLWMASIRPLLDAREFDGSPASVMRIFARDPDMAACYRKVFRESPRHNPERTVVNVGKALAAFEETLVTARTPFDDYRDALRRNDPAAMGAYPRAAQRGLQLFVGDGGCANCHAGPNFSDGEFHPGAGADTKPAIVFVSGTPRAETDSGRLEGAHSLQTSPLNLLGRYNDDLSQTNAAATRKLRVHDGMRGEFRTPSLRNVTVTGPYMHDGRFEQLRDAALHVSRDSTGPPTPVPFSAKQADDLVAFLETLTDRYAARRPWTAEPLAICP